jgi:hypothetical protein
MSMSSEQAAGQSHKLRAFGAENSFEYQAISNAEGYNWDMKFKSFIRCQGYTFGR